ncbi:unnamed protein product, partial [Phaeothamnion confervicola]
MSGSEPASSESPPGRPIYESLPLGDTFIEALNSMVEDYGLPPEQAEELLAAYNDVIATKYNQLDKKRKDLKASMQGKIRSFNRLDDTWRLDLKDVEIKYASGAVIKTDCISVYAEREKPALVTSRTSGVAAVAAAATTIGTGAGATACRRAPKQPVAAAMASAGRRGSGGGGSGDGSGGGS